MGPIAARHARAVVANVEQVLALELLCAAQGLDFRVADGRAPGAGVAEAHRLLREVVGHLGSDREPGPDIAAALELVHGANLVGLVAEA